ncbi:MAG TPA: hypothetical protein VFW15_09655 [Thermoanaerobaculia bacterium]|nr:hypothetical protein [Thermoanaerobaculia bacterium]
MNRKAIAACSFALALLPLGVLAGDKREFTDTFPLGECTFQTVGGNPYFILQPERELHFSNAECVAEGDCDELEVLVITVLTETHDVTFEIDGVPTTVTTRVVEEHETVEGEVVEVSRNFFAVCDETRDVYYFGEEVVGAGGEWEAGMNGARPGLIMPGGAFLLGARYFQEIAPEVALDRAEHVAMNLELELPAGDFGDCVEVEETTPLEKGTSTKIYCPGTGLVFDDGLELTEVVEP